MTRSLSKPRSYLDGEVCVEQDYILVTSRVVDSVARAEQITRAIDLARPPSRPRTPSLTEAKGTFVLGRPS